MQTGKTIWWIIFRGFTFTVCPSAGKIFSPGKRNNLINREKTWPGKKFLIVYDLPSGIENFSGVKMFYEVFNSIQSRVDVTFVIAYHRKTEFSLLPQILVSYLGDGDIEFIFCPVNNLFYYLPFSLEGIITRNSDVQLTDADYHK